MVGHHLRRDLPGECANRHQGGGGGGDGAAEGPLALALLEGALSLPSQVELGFDGVSHW